MNAKEHLKQYTVLCGKVDRYKERIEQIEASLNSAIKLDGLPRGTKTGNPTQETAIKLASIQSRLNIAMMEAELTRQTIADEIEEMTTPIYKRILYLRYIKQKDGRQMTWEDITDEISVGRRERYDAHHVMGYMHGQALKEFEWILQKEK